MTTSNCKARLQDKSYTRASWLKEAPEIASFIQNRIARARAAAGRVVIYGPILDVVDKLAALVGCEGYHRNTIDRAGVLERFRANTTGVIAATSTLGMGLDIPNIRSVIRVGLPRSMLDFAQESGRVGRDGLPSEAIIIQPHGLPRPTWDPIHIDWQTAQEEQERIDTYAYSGSCLNLPLEHQGIPRTSISRSLVEILRTVTDIPRISPKPTEGRHNSSAARPREVRCASDKASTDSSCAGPTPDVAFRPASLKSEPDGFLRGDIVIRVQSLFNYADPTIALHEAPSDHDPPFQRLELVANENVFMDIHEHNLIGRKQVFLDHRFENKQGAQVRQTSDSVFTICRVFNDHAPLVQD
ncbi:uncharacterized protein N7515_000671 [Penicillium bovifimosum]|uniref:DNA 3'-5' helicase n=1 Tax=Penicillium bovifimosum TaxID=126998 RepID=A0A9W9HFV4_9EURO|nr:uncharacterized protein N7515_000671 [Penicillium bovifimosum]KAJ5146107.1 hypothetical protein N7515_000671 [Penicillium bovifimosum]